MPDPAPFAVAPLEAIDYLRQKLDVPTRTWTNLWQGMHARAFVIAGAEGEALLADFHDAVNRAIAEGRTLADFRADFDRIVADHGWSYRGGRNWRSAVIFNTNLRMAYAAGRWAQIQRLKAARPYLRYVAVMDERTRPLHAAWHNTVLPVGHPWWRTHAPPNGWNCRCTLQSLSERDLKRYGLAVSATAPPVTFVAEAVNTPGGPVTIRVPEGIDPGFAYNPGEAGFGRGAELLALERHGAWEPLEGPGAGFDPGPLPVDVAAASVPPSPTPADEETLRQRLAQALGGVEAVFADPAGSRVRIGQAVVDHMLADPSRLDGRERYFGLLPSLIEKPAEIWIGWVRSSVSGRVAMRRRYVKLVRLGADRTIGLIADADGGECSGLTFFGSRGGGLRTGHRVYRRDGDH